MSDTYVLIQVKLPGLLYSALPQSGLNVNFIATDVLRQVRNQLGWESDQYGQPTGLSQTTAVNDEAAHGVVPIVTDATVRDTQAS